jgi:hypothetical protein
MILAICIFTLTLCSCKKDKGDTSATEESSVSGENFSQGDYAVSETAESVSEKTPAAEYLLEYTIKDGQVRITKYKGNDSELVIPEEIVGCKVTQISRGMLSDTNVTSLTLPESMTEFDGISLAPYLQEINLPFSLESFSGSIINLPKLTDVNISDNDNFVSIDGILYSSDGKTLIYFPQGRSGTFTIPENVENIAEHAFRYSALTGITLGDSLISIGTGAFSDSGIDALTIPSSVTEIGSRIMGGDSDKKIILPANTEIAEKLAYYDIAYYGETTLQMAIRKAKDCLNDDDDYRIVLADLNFDGFPEMIESYRGYYYGHNNYTYSVTVFNPETEQWDRDFIYTLPVLDLYYDSENSLYFYCGKEEKYTLYRHTLCSDGFITAYIGTGMQYSKYDYSLENCYDYPEVVSLSEIEGEFSIDFYNYKNPEAGQTDPDTAFDDLYRKAMEKYEYVKTVNLEDFFEQAGNERLYIAGDFADDPQTGDLPSKEYVTENYCSAAYDVFWEEFYPDSSFDAYTENQRLTSFYIRNGGGEVDLDGIEKLQNIYALSMYGSDENYKNLQKLALLPHLKALVTDNIEFASGLENLEFLYLTVLDYQFLVTLPDDYFAPIYSCKNLKYLCVGDYISEGQKKEIEKNMPQVVIMANTYEERQAYEKLIADKVESSLNDGANPTC